VSGGGKSSESGGWGVRALIDPAMLVEIEAEAFVAESID
jgi:hypothetical protein